MNYEEFLQFIHSNGFVADQKYVKGGGVGKIKAKLVHKEIGVEYYENDNLIFPSESQKKQWEIFGLPNDVEKIEQSFENIVDEFSGKTKKDIENQANQNIESGEYSYLGFNPNLWLMFENSSKYDNGGSVGQTDYSVAQTILNQLGGMKRLVIMTGAYNFVASSNAVSFRIKNRKVNYIKITLNGKDLYDVKFSRIFNYQEKVVAELNDIYFDQLIPIFEQNTGMYLKMFKKGGMVSTQNRDMVISQLKAIHHHQKEMLDTLKNSGEVEAWVLAKVSNASSDLSDIAHYLEFKE